MLPPFETEHAAARRPARRSTPCGCVTYEPIPGKTIAHSTQSERRFRSHDRKRSDSTGILDHFAPESVIDFTGMGDRIHRNPRSLSTGAGTARLRWRPGRFAVPLEASLSPRRRCLLRSASPGVPRPPAVSVVLPVTMVFPVSVVFSIPVVTRLNDRHDPFSCIERGVHDHV